MRKTLLVSTLVMVSCIDAPDDPATEVVEQLGQSTQGQSTQGQSTQGQSTQSNGIEAVSVTGAKKNGVTLTAVKVINGELRATGKNNELLTGDKLVGTVLRGVRGNGYTAELRIEAHFMDSGTNLISSAYPAYQSNSDVHLYKVSVLTNGVPTPLCSKKYGVTNGVYTETYDSETAVMLPGVWLTENGQWMPSLTSFTIGCWEGTIAKCVRWGYKPWKSMTPSGSTTPVSLHNLHLACVRGAMADYCGDGTSFTQTGTLIDVSDRYNFITKVSEYMQFPVAFSEESSFDIGGAGCVDKARRAELGASCPPTIEFTEPDYSGGPGTGTKPKKRTIPAFKKGERASCMGSSQLVMFDTSTYCRNPFDAVVVNATTKPAPMAADCNSCTASVCTTLPKCCDLDDPGTNDSVGNWDADCVTEAKKLGACTGWIIVGPILTL